MNKYSAVAIGVSAGGLNALSIILPHLPADYSIPVIVVQHQIPTANDYLATHLGEKCRLKVEYAGDSRELKPGSVYLAPPDYHLIINADKTMALSSEELVNFARPSVDVLFQSAADVYKKELVGVVLTGANIDGSLGLKSIKNAGGLAVVQDPDTAEMVAMPKGAIMTTEVDHILPLEEIGPFLTTLC